MRRPGWYPRAWSSWHLHVVSLHLNSWTALSASFTFFSMLVSERSGRREPPAERSALYNNAIIQQFRISVPLIAHALGNQFYRSPGTHQLAYTAVIMSYYCRCVPGVAIVEPITLCFLFFGGNSRGVAVYYHGCSVFPRRLSVIESGSGFFVFRSDLINSGLVIGNRVFWPLSDRNRFSSRYATLVLVYSVSSSLCACLPG